MSGQLQGTSRVVYIVDGARTPFLKARGKPGPFTSSDLAVGAGKPLLARQPFAASDLDEVVIGCMMPSADEATIGRIIGLRLGTGKHVPGWSVQRNCASGLQAIDTAAMNIATGRTDLSLAGGTDAMSHAPLLFNKAMVRWLSAWFAAKSVPQRLSSLAKIRPGFFVPVISLLKGLTDPLNGLSMGQTAEIVAHRFGITREEMDEFSARSHRRVLNSAKEILSQEIETIYSHTGDYFEQDDGVREDSTPEKLAKLRPFFDKKYGAVTAGNSSQVTDGAALVILASEKAVEQYQLPVLAKIVDSQWSAMEPAQMGLGPVHAITPILNRQNLSMNDVDYWEINEAFAGQVLGCLRAWEDDGYCQQELGLDKAFGTLDEDKLNVDGGAIALGHPIGASGARLVLHMAKILEKKQARYGIASLCIGGGQGGAMLIERV